MTEEITNLAIELERIANLSFDNPEEAKRAFKHLEYPSALPYLKDAVHQHIFLMNRKTGRGRKPKANRDSKI